MYVACKMQRKDVNRASHTPPGRGPRHLSPDLDQLRHGVFGRVNACGDNPRSAQHYAGYGCGIVDRDFTIRTGGKRPREGPSATPGDVTLKRYARFSAGQLGAIDLHALHDAHDVVSGFADWDALDEVDCCRR